MPLCDILSVLCVTYCLFFVWYIVCSLCDILSVLCVTYCLFFVWHIVCSLQGASGFKGQKGEPNYVNFGGNDITVDENMCNCSHTFVPPANRHTQTINFSFLLCWSSHILFFWHDCIILVFYIIKEIFSLFALRVRARFLEFTYFGREKNRKYVNYLLLIIIIIKRANTYRISW